MTNPRFEDRYAVLELEDGGIVVDLEKGTYLAVNGTAATICAVLASNADDRDLVADVASRLRITPEMAARALADVRAGLQSRAPKADIGPFLYARASKRDGYILEHSGRIRLEIAEDGSRVRVSAGPITEAQIYDYLRAIAPKIMFLRGGVVLHGSALRVGPGLRAVCGASGAGKTTTARAFVQAGLSGVSEDLLVLASLSPPAAHIDGERAVHGWARKTARRVIEGTTREIDTFELDDVLQGETSPIRELWFIEASERDESREAKIRPRPLPQLRASVRLMSAVFLGAAAPTSWRRFLKIVKELSSVVPCFDVAMPSGLARLDRAARDYTENCAS